MIISPCKSPEIVIIGTCLSQTESLNCSPSAKSLFNNWLAKHSFNLIILDRAQYLPIVGEAWLFSIIPTTGPFQCIARLHHSSWNQLFCCGKDLTRSALNGKDLNTAISLARDRIEWKRLRPSNRCYLSLPDICETPFGDSVLKRQWKSFSSFYCLHSFLCGWTSYPVHFQRVGESASWDTRR